MLLTLTATGPGAGGLGKRLGAPVDEVRSLSLRLGSVHLFWPEVQEERVTCALLFEPDPLELARWGRDLPTLEPFVGDRGYVASAHLALAASELFQEVLAREDGEEDALALEASAPAIRCLGGEGFLRELFAPLGYEVTAEPASPPGVMAGGRPLPYHTVTVRGRRAVPALLAHLLVLLPAVDDRLQALVAPGELERLLRVGEGFLPDHPCRDLIVGRYRRLTGPQTREPLARLCEEPDPDAAALRADDEEAILERPLGLAAARREAVQGALAAASARRVVVIGLADPGLLVELAGQGLEGLAGLDASVARLERARAALAERGVGQEPPAQLLQGIPGRPDGRLAGFDAIVLSEVLEHLDPARLGEAAASVLGAGDARLVLATTPNARYDARFDALEPGTLRHRGHRFEWDEEALRRFAEEAGEAHGYAARLVPIGPEDDELGAPTQMVVWSR